MPYIQSGNLLDSRTDSLLLDKADLENYDNECEDIYFFTQREVCVIYSCLRYSNWEARWKDRDIDKELVETIHRKLLMLCVKDLVKSNLAIFAALTGQAIDLSDDEAIQTFLSSPLTFDDPKQAVVPAIDRIVNDDDPNYEQAIENIGTILGFVAV